MQTPASRDSVREVPRVVSLSAQRDGRDFDRALQPSTSRRYLRYTYLAVQRVLAREISAEVRLLSEYIGTWRTHLSLSLSQARLVQGDANAANAVDKQAATMHPMDLI